MANFKTRQLDIQDSNTNVSINVLPETGHILPFAGPSNKIPSGWVLCDGANGTPDLRGKLPGDKSGASLLSTEDHTHTFTQNIGAFNTSTVSHNSNISSAASGTNNTTHTHGNDNFMSLNGGYSGPANRSNGTQSNVTSQYHAHPSGSTSGSNTTAGAGAHNHGFDSYNHSLSGNAHSHSISASIGNAVATTHVLPSIFYVNFIMKVA
jgi:hypothetical protein